MGGKSVKPWENLGGAKTVKDTFNMIWLLIVCIPLAIPIVYVVGVIVGLIGHFIADIKEAHELNKRPPVFINEPCIDSTEDTAADTDEPPYYITDKLAAYDNQIEAYNALLETLNQEYAATLRHYSQTTADDVKRANIRKKQADIMLKLATTEERTHKLRDKARIE